MAWKKDWWEITAAQLKNEEADIIKSHSKILTTNKPATYELPQANQRQKFSKTIQKMLYELSSLEQRQSRYSQKLS